MAFKAIPWEIQRAKYLTPSTYFGFRRNSSAYFVGAGKEGFAPIFWGPLLFDSLELLESLLVNDSANSSSKTKGKGKVTPMVPKRRSMRIFRTRFPSTRKDKGEGSGPEVIVTIDDDDDSSDESGVAEAEISTHNQESTHGASGMDEDPDEGQYYSRDEDTFSNFDIPLEELGASDMPLEFASGREQRVNIALVVPTAGYSSEAGLDFPATVADAVLGLPAAWPPAPHVLGTSDTTADTSPLLPVVPPPTPLILGTSDMAVDASPPLPAVRPPTPPILGTSDMAVDASPPLPAVPPLTEIIDNSHKDSDTFIAGTSGKHSCGKSMSWQNWENSFMAFKAFFDGGVTILQSVDELLPLCHKFNGYVAFQGALVYPKTVAVLRKFMDKYGNFMEATDITPSFSRCATFRALGLALHGIDTMQLLDITDHKRFCWRDAICEAITLGFHVDFLLNLVKDIARAVFGARAIRSTALSHGPDEIRAAANSLNIKQRELEDKHRELHALLLAKGISADNSECVTEAAARASPRAFSVLFGRSL